MPLLRNVIASLLYFWWLAAFVCLAQAPVGADASLREKVEAMTREPAVARAHWGVSVTKLDGTLVLGINDGQYFQPASNAKLFTTAAAMALLPMEERLRTDVVTFGSFEPGGVLHGELQFLGAGDANFSGRPVPYRRTVGDAPQPPRDELRYIRELADQIKAAGVSRVIGNIVAVDGNAEPYPAGWEIDDAPWYYGAPVSELMIADNALTLTVTPSRVLTGEAQATVTLDPALPYYTVDAAVQTRKGTDPTRIDIDRPIGSRVLRVFGVVNADAKPYTQAISIDSPAEYAAMALKAALEERGIAVTGRAVRLLYLGETPKRDFDEFVHRPVEPLRPLPKLRTGYGDTPFPTCGDHVQTGETRCVLASHASPPLYDDIVITNKVSQNLHAEALLRQLAAVQGSWGFGSNAEGQRVLRSFLTTMAGIDPQDFVFYDGSGLSGHDLVTPRAVTQLLRYGAGQTWGARWKASLPVGGDDGGLRARFADAPLKGHVFAKTGTLGEARALSGYLDCASGQTVVFSVMVSAHTPLDKEDEKVMDRIVGAIAAAE